ncbi:substrate-binding periplasmic protein [Phyllobacterium chamaecytisi]|uniref:substrate-binding periplasmic protein n=1 Tax=Phyllobacterium chamaecytisi TaxID=2876082 RepID=UPI001CCA71A6|nr:transporter substrate-binding domain-containing protein [Phyllobacterium sp. KW56]MBZ9603288.1 transporter substrate-binding domain-containing protein [Phyllobacterium sp. KW56]
MRMKFVSGLTVAFYTVAATICWAADLPAPGQSPRIDAIKDAGVIRVGVLHNMPWLVENTSGEGERWSGPAWLLANEFASQLGVRLEAIPVSHETKIPALAANQVDITITPLGESPERLKVVDFVQYSTTSVCMFGLKNNPKFSEAKSVDDLNKPDLTIAFLLGAVEETWVKKRFDKAQHRGIITSSVVPIDDIMSGRADSAPINRVQWPALQAKLPALGILPSENNCQDSKEKAQSIGMAIDKGQDVFLQWLRATTAEVMPKVQEEEKRVIAERL